MTNEEKALELFPDMPTLIPLCAGVREKLVEMAEWKDSEFDAKLNYFYNLINDGIPFEKAYFCVTGKNWQRSIDK